jgi:hypothetical protein
MKPSTVRALKVLHATPNHMTKPGFVEGQTVVNQIQYVPLYVLHASSMN